MADGRLDEAFEIVSAADLRSHRKGQELAGRLARALLERGRKFLSSGLLPQAGADADKAGRLAGNLPEIAELHAAVVAAMGCQHRDANQHAHVLAAARQQINNGFLTVGQKLLAAVKPGHGDAAILAGDVEARRALIDAVATKVAAALDGDDWEAAIDELSRIRPAECSDARLREMIRRTSDVLGQRIHAAIQNGRLDQAAVYLARLQRLPEQSVEMEELRRALDQMRLAWRCITSGQLRQAEEILARLANIATSANWIQDTLKNLREAAAAWDQLRTGPLGLLADVAHHDMTQPMLHATRPHGQPAAPAAEPRPHIPSLPSMDDSIDIPSRFVVQVDGVGSFYVVRGDHVTVGPVSTSPPPDLPLLADAHTPRLTIERQEEDYFLRSGLPINVNARPTNGRLLANGDEIALTPRCRMTFRTPSPASTSAVLELTSARLPRGDVRRAILMDRELIIGPGAAAHIRCDDLPEPVVLHLQGSKLRCRARAVVQVNGTVGDGTGIGLGCRVSVGDLSFTVVQG